MFFVFKHDSIYWHIFASHLLCSLIFIYFIFIWFYKTKFFPFIRDSFYHHISDFHLIFRVHTTFLLNFIFFFGQISYFFHFDCLKFLFTGFFNFFYPKPYAFSFKFFIRKHTRFFFQFFYWAWCFEVMVDLFFEISQTHSMFLWCFLVKYLTICFECIF